MKAYVTSEAKRAAVRRYKAKQRELQGKPPASLSYLSSDPIIALIDELLLLEGSSAEEVLNGRGLCSRTYYRMKRSGRVSESVADLFACRLGIPTVRLYPELLQIEVA